MTLDEVIDMRNINRLRYLNTIQNSELRNGAYYRNRSRFDIFKSVAEKYGFRVTYIGSRKVKVIIEKAPSYHTEAKSILQRPDSDEAVYYP